MQGTSHTRLNASPLREVPAKMEADAASSIKDRQIILSPAELMKPPGVLSSSRSNPKNSPSSTKQSSPVPDLGLESAVNKVMSIFRGRSASSATAEDKRRLQQKVGITKTYLTRQRTLEHLEWNLLGDFSEFKINGDSKEAL